LKVLFTEDPLAAILAISAILAILK